MLQLTGNPVRYECVASDCVTRGILNLKQRRGSINYAAFCIQSFTLVLLLVDTNKVCEVVRFLL